MKSDIGIIKNYTFCFIFSISFCGLLMLIVEYIRQLNGRNDISKLSLRPYLYAMMFSLVSCIEILFWEAGSQKMDYLHLQGVKFGDDLTLSSHVHEFYVCYAIAYLRYAAFYSFVSWECLHQNVLSLFVTYQDLIKGDEIIVYREEY